MCQQSYHKDPREVGGFAEMMESTQGNILCNNLEIVAEELYSSCISHSDARELNNEFPAIPSELFTKLNWIDLIDSGLEPTKIIRIFILRSQRSLRGEL